MLPPLLNTITWIFKPDKSANGWTGVRRWLNPQRNCQIGIAVTVDIPRGDVYGAWRIGRNVYSLPNQPTIPRIQIGCDGAMGIHHANDILQSIAIDVKGNVSLK
jgi:hypothetical protein